MSIAKTFWRKKYRFDLGMSFMSIINFGLLVFTTAKVYQISLVYAVLVGVPFAFFMVWAWGYFLDRVMKAQEQIEKNLVERQPLVRESYQKIDKILKIVSKV